MTNKDFQLTVADFLEKISERIIQLELDVGYLENSPASRLLLMQAEDFKQIMEAKHEVNQDETL